MFVLTLVGLSTIIPKANWILVFMMYKTSVTPSVPLLFQSNAEHPALHCSSFYSRTKWAFKQKHSVNRSFHAAEMN